MMWWNRDIKPAPLPSIVYEAPKLPPSTTRRGVIVRREKVLDYLVRGERIFLAIRLEDGEGNGSKSDTVVCQADASGSNVALVLLKVGDAVTAEVRQSDSGEVQVVNLKVDVSSLA